MNIFLWKKIVFTLVISCPFMLGCTSSSSVFEKARDCAGAITAQGTCEALAAANTNANRQIPSSPPAQSPINSSSDLATVESRIYLDASESMGGFAVPTENNQFIKLLGTIGYTMPGCHLFKYGTPTGKTSSGAPPAAAGDITNNLTEIRFSKDFENKAFYNLGNNQDDILINFLASEEKPARSVLITDGVYSSPGAELQPETVKSIENWMKRGRFFGILIFNSPFKGRFWSENKRSWIENADIEKRPFYAFVFSPDETGFNELRDKLAVEFPDLSVLAFPKEAALCKLEPKTKNSLEQSAEPPDSPFYLYQYTSEIFDDNNSAQLFYDLVCKPAEAYPVGKFAVKTTLDYYSWENDDFKKNDNPPPYHIEYTPKNDVIDKAETPPALPAATQDSETAASPSPLVANKGNMKISFNQEPKNLYGFYHLRINLSGNNNLLPKIRASSTQDDSVPEDMDKTFRFYEFIAALTTVHLRDKEAIKLPTPLFVVLTN